MRAVFFGTPQWAVPSLTALLEAGVEVASVVTNPDRPAGRGMRLRPSPVKQAALAAGLEVWQPRSARDPALERLLRDLAPDVAVVVAYGRILPGALLEVPSLGFVNVHFSLLPAYRGAAPVQRAIMAGEKTTGVSIMVLTEGMDEGPVLAAEPEPIHPSDTAGSLGERLAARGARLLVRTLPAYASGELRPVPQDHSRATYAPRLTDEEARIDWTRPAPAVRDHIRALNPSPGAWTTLAGRRLKVFMAETVPGEGPEGRRLGPGEVSLAGGLYAGTGRGVLELTDVALQGRRRMTGAELARGLRIDDAGLRFE